MIRVLTTLSLCLVCLTTSAQASQDRSTAGAAGAPKIELITMGEGELLWERWGHVALCVHRPGRAVVCYNYGTTNFSDPVSLVWDFLRGRSQFWVSRATRVSMVRFYTEKLDRTMWSQMLPLSPEKARLAAELLERNAQGANKFYKYHHYDDNCSTRVRDIIDRVTDGALSSSTSSSSSSSTSSSSSGSDRYEFSLREITRRGLSEYTAFVLLSDYVIGRPADRDPTLYEAMHLPNVLRQQVELHLGVVPVVIYERQGRDFDVSNPASRVWMILIALLIAAPAFLTWLLGRFRRLGLAVSVLPGGLIGLIGWTAVIISALPEIRQNEAVLVAVPLDLLLPWLSPAWRQRYARLRIIGLVIVAALSVVGVLHQPLWIPILLALLPLVVAVLPER